MNDIEYLNDIVKNRYETDTAIRNIARILRDLLQERQDEKQE